MRKLIAFCLVSLLLFGAAACNRTVQPQPLGSQQPADGSSSDPNAESTEAGQNGQLPYVPIGTIADLKTDGAFRLIGLRLDGSRAGGRDDASPELVRNGKPIGTDNIRTLFELNEWIDFSLGYEYGSEPGALAVAIFTHRSSAEYAGRDLMDGAAYYAQYDLPYETYPEPLNDEFYLDPAEAEAGVYDMVIAYNGEIIGVLTLHFFNEGELANKTQQELEALLAVG